MRVFRRVMLGGGIDIESLPDTQKLYYKATAKVSPKSESLGSTIIKNSWDSTTGEGIIICSKDISIIASGAFYLNTSLTSITIPNSVTSIEYQAFEHCSSLTSITIGNGVTSIDEYAFWGCSSMQYYDFSTNESVPTLKSTYAFNNIPSTCKIIVPDALYDEWITAGYWSRLVNYIIKKSDWDASQTTE